MLGSFGSGTDSVVLGVLGSSSRNTQRKCLNDGLQYCTVKTFFRCLFLFASLG